MNLKFLFASFLCVSVCVASAVTRKEMDHARAIAAKEYLRYANNGSDYLDKLSFSSMAELEAALKTKEKQNIADFKKVSVPSDFASWDKEKLAEYWGNTFFKSSALSEKGKGARSVVAKKIRAMKIEEPKPAEPEKPAEDKQQEDVPQIAPEDQTPAQPSQEEIEARLKATEDSIAALAQAEENATADDEERKSDGGTTIYIVILAILIAVVIGLVVYASKVFGGMGKKSSRDDDDEDGFEHDRHQRALDSLSANVAAKDAEIRSLKRELDAERSRNRELEMKVASLTEEVSRRHQAPRPEPRRERVIFLARAGRQGIFTRADKEPKEDISIYRLVTTDGVTGTFDIIDDERVIDAILDSPHALLDNAVLAEIPDNTDAVSGIETDTAGTAVFEDGRWRVVRKARLSFVY